MTAPTSKLQAAMEILKNEPDISAKELALRVGASYGARYSMMSQAKKLLRSGGKRPQKSSGGGKKVKPKKAKFAAKRKAAPAADSSPKALRGGMTLLKEKDHIVIKIPLGEISQMLLKSMFASDD